MKFVIFEAANSWQMVSSDTLRNSWKNLLGTSSRNNIVENESNSSIMEIAHQIEGFSNLNEEELNDWINIDSNDPGFEILTDEVIINSIKNRTIDDTANLQENIVSCSNAVEALSTLKNYFCQNHYDESDDENNNSINYHLNAIEIFLKD
jgi:hypothetical protein